MSKQITVGAKVKCKMFTGPAASRLFAPDVVYEVDSITEGGDVYIKGVPHPVTGWWIPSRFDVVDEPTQESAPFAVGDMVTPRTSILGFTPGMPYVVTKVELVDNGFWRLIFNADDDGQARFRPADGFERYEEVPPEPVVEVRRKLEVGDVVTATTGTLDITQGNTYVVTSAEYDGCVYVRDDIGDENGLLAADEFTLVQPPEHAPVSDFRIRKHGARGEIRGTPYATLEAAEQAITRYMPGTVYEIVAVQVVRTVKVEQETRLVDFDCAA